MENLLGNTLSTEGAQARLDRTVKKLLSIRYVLAFIMTRAIKEYRNCTIEEAMAAIDGDPIITRKDLHECAAQGSSGTSCREYDSRVSRRTVCVIL